jgi:outer membrane protein
MKLKFVCSLTAAAVLVSAAALAQTSGSSAALPSAPGVASDPAAATTNASGAKIGAINVEQAIFASNEGQRDFEALSKKLQPKQDELKKQNDDIEALKKQLTGPSVTDETKGSLTRQIETKQKSLERQAQEAQEDARNQENEIAQRILQKMAPLIVKYATDNSFGMIIDTSTNNQWPNGPVLWHGPSLDITKPVVDAYNTQSGVPAPAKPAGGATGSLGSRPAGAKPATTTTKPATPAPGATTPKN